MARQPTGTGEGQNIWEGQYTVCLWSGGIPQKYFSYLATFFNVYLMKGLQKYAKICNHTMAF